MTTKQKLVLVTGGSRGLGRNMALRIAEKGMDVIITYQKQKKDADDVVSEIKKMGRQAAALQLDAGNVKTFAAFIESLRGVMQTTFKRDKLDVIVNNAGIGIYEMFAETSEETVETLMNIQFKGVFFLTQRILPILNDGGSIVNISSGLARFALPGYSAYGSLKAAIESLTRYQAKELGARQIRANAVAPGAIATDFAGGSVRDNPQINSFVSSVTALGRPGQAEDIGGVVAFLCTDDASWINGQRIEVSGGMFL